MGQNSEVGVQLGPEITNATAGGKIAAATILVVDDSRLQRKIITAYLESWGYKTLQAGTAEQGLDLCRRHGIDIVISDWKMPGLSGPEFCRLFRQEDTERYGYFILVTSKSDKADVAEGLNHGADDFLTKPVSSTELLARIRAGERVLEMERKLRATNRDVQRALDKISGLYSAMERDLATARDLQNSLVPERSKFFGTAGFHTLFRPSGHVGGDLVGYEQITEHHVAFFCLDVSGHGVASAMITARLASYLSGRRGADVLTCRNGQGLTVPRKPSDVVGILNSFVLDGVGTDHYFTIIYGHMALDTGKVALCQCGHPSPIIQRCDGKTESTGEGGLPVGLFADANWTDNHISLAKGDRLFLVSDGLTELSSPAGVLLDQEGMEKIIAGHHNTESRSVFDAIMWDLSDFIGNSDFPDDISGLLIESEADRLPSQDGRQKGSVGGTGQQ